jgi:hypothetical protein
MGANILIDFGRETSLTNLCSYICCREIYLILCLDCELLHSHPCYNFAKSKKLQCLSDCERPFLITLLDLASIPS